MSTLTHLPKLTRTACGKHITPNITLRHDLNMFKLSMADNVGCCSVCCFSEFGRCWHAELGNLKLTFWKRFGTFPDDDLIMDEAHKRAIKKYQDKGFNV